MKNQMLLIFVAWAALSPGSQRINSQPVPGGTQANTGRMSGDTVHPAEKGVEPRRHKEDVVRLSEDVRREFGVETAAASPGQLRREIQIPGEVKLNETRMAHIVPRFPGVVISVRHQLGDRVKAGEVMAIIESNESLVPYELKSLVDGTVIKQHIALGEVLELSSEAFVVADLSTVWVDFSVYQKEIGLVHKDQWVTVLAPHGLGTAAAKISILGRP